MLLFSLLACSGEPATACDELDVASCGDDDAVSAATCVVIAARPATWSEELTCFDLGGTEEVGCMSADVGCDDVITYAGPGDGTCFEFGDSCIPDGWIACEPSPASAEVCAS